MALAIAACPVRGAVTPAEVRESIRKAKTFVYSQLKGNSWEKTPHPVGDGPADPVGREWGGYSALAVYALLASGESPQDSRLAPAIDFLKKADLRGTYALALRAQIWQYLRAGEQNREDLAQDMASLVSSPHLSGPHEGFYSYGIGQHVPQEDWYDLSNSQFGVLGVWACAFAGADVPDSYWRRIDQAWRKAQRRTGDDPGGWAYHGEGQESTPNMTAAGLASLYIAQDGLLRRRPGRMLIGHDGAEPPPLPCLGGTADADIDAGLGYIDRHITALIEGNHYGLYALERVGAASGRKYFDQVDWYKAGANRLVHEQAKDGSWKGDFGTLPCTAFSLLFLSRGCSPVVMSKLEYNNAAVAPETRPTDSIAVFPGASSRPARKSILWNQRPRDLAAFSRWSGHELERNLNWQLVNLDATSETLHDAPILFITGSAALDFPDSDTEALKQFISEGGLVLGNADCGKPLLADGRPADAFGRSFVALGEALFPGRHFRKLPPDHLVFTAEQFSPGHWRTKPPQLNVLGMSNGVREMMILLPEQDLSRIWQSDTYAQRPDAFELGQDIFLYAVDRENLRERGDTYVVSADPSTPRGRPIKLARLMVGDNPDPEPGGWGRLTHLLHNTCGIELQVTSARFGAGQLVGADLAHLTGTTAFRIDALQRRELNQFIAAGGTLIIDAAGGSREFADAAEKELSFMFGGDPGKFGVVLPANDDLYVRPGGKADARIETFGYRRCFQRQFATRAADGSITMPDATFFNHPRVRALMEGDRALAYYSREDLSAGLVGEPVDGILGYDPATSTAIMRNMILAAARYKRRGEEPKASQRVK